MINVARRLNIYNRPVLKEYRLSVAKFLEAYQAHALDPSVPDARLGRSLRQLGAALQAIAGKDS